MFKLEIYDVFMYNNQKLIKNLLSKLVNFGWSIIKYP